MDAEVPLLSEKRPSAVTTKDVFFAELKKLARIAIPMLVVTVCQQMVIFVSTMMLGHISELSLSGGAVATSFTNVTGFSLIFGMASALETLCGQAYGAGQYHKLGTYTYGAIMSLTVVAIPISILWVFMDKLLILVGQDPLISAEAGRYSVWLISAIFPYAILQCLVRYLQMQSLIVPMLLSSALSLCFHIPVCWALSFRSGLGSAGPALAIGLSYWFNVILLVVYVKYSSACEKSRVCLWNDSFARVGEFFRLAVPSASMACLEWWTFEIVILLGGLLPNPQVETSVLSICLMICSLHFYIPFSIGAGASTRISNELGAGNTELARMAVWGVTIIGMIELAIAAVVLMSLRSVVGYAFSNETEVVNYIKRMTPLVSLMLVSDGISGLLSGVARGSGWQHLGAYVNLGAYYLVGAPAAGMLGFMTNLRGMGLWMGLNLASLVQNVVLALITIFTDWKKQESKAQERLLNGSDSPAVENGSC
ncbi:protein DETOXIFICATION 14-like [Ipomoea triloba]|uniref:protein DETOXIFICATION 14-like n=1 Tax=Ipomoea triloba TaxID=35885 RepID=UPI00125E669E|nr:protein DETOXIFICATION 14-like [Ipomoea triloba]GLL26361.1 protein DETOXIFICATION 14-like [Ipomoea trifida]